MGKQPNPFRKRHQGGHRFKLQGLFGPSTRVVRVRTLVLPPPRYLVDPSHDAPGTFGGTKMSVILGPAAAQSIYRGSGTNANSIRKWMKPLHNKNDGMDWKAGHLLNADLGGSGTATENLTPLSGVANRNHSTYENRIKRACESSYLYHNQHKDHQFWYGIKYEVTVAGTPYKTTKPYDKVASHITIYAQAVKVHKIRKTIKLLNNNTNPMRFQTISNVQIDQE